MSTAGPAPASSGKAYASLIFGILAIICVPLNFLPAILGLLLGILGVRDVNRSAGTIGGKGLAIAGIITSCVGFLCGCASIGLSIPIGMGFMEANKKHTSLNNLKIVGLAVHNYCSMYEDRLPTAIVDDQKKPLLSIRVQLLPYMEEDGLYRMLDKKQAWDAAPNKPLLTPRPRFLADPQNPGLTPDATPYRFFVGPNTIWSEPGQQTRYSIANLPDGTSNTILCVGATDGVPWSKPEELTYVPNQTIAKLGPPGKNFIIVAMCDGSVRFVSKSISDQTFRNAVNPADGNLLGPDW